MKRTYLMPAMQVNEAQVANMMAVSIVDGNADPGQPVLGKEDESWDIWADDAE